MQVSLNCVRSMKAYPGLKNVNAELRNTAMKNHVAFAGGKGSGDGSPPAVDDGKGSGDG